MNILILGAGFVYVALGVVIGYLIRPSFMQWRSLRRQTRIAKKAGYDNFWDYVAAGWDNDVDYDPKWVTCETCAGSGEVERKESESE